MNGLPILPTGRRVRSGLWATDVKAWERLDPDALLTITVVGYGYTHEWHIIINSLLAQTDDRWVAQLINDGPDPGAEAICSSYVDAYPERLAYAETPIRLNDWGHSLRVVGLEMARTRWWACQNGDNYLMPRYVELVLGAATEAIVPSTGELANADVVIFPCVHSYENVNGRRGEPAYSLLEVALRRNRCDAGTLAVRTDLARHVGWRSLSINSDGDFIDDLARQAPRVVTLPNILMVHN